LSELNYYKKYEQLEKVGTDHGFSFESVPEAGTGKNVCMVFW
jgi:hypothetical protein